MYDVAVIGGGMLGAAAAYRLAQAGRRVLILEAREPAAGASGNSFAWLNAVSKEPEAYHRLNADGIAEYRRLEDELDDEFGLRGGGSLQWAATADGSAAMRDRTGRLEARGYPARWIGREEALSLEPHLALATDVEGVAYHPGDGWVDAPRLVRTFVNRTVSEQADLWRGARALHLQATGDRIATVETERGPVQARSVLLCAGIGTADLLAPLGVELPVERVPGLLAITSPVPEPLGRVVYAPGVHLRPDVNGGLRLGADDIDALVDEGTPADPVPACAQELLERAEAVFLPARGARVERAHIGVRPVPGDGQTIAGPVPGIANAWVVVTHSGITLGPLLGRLIAEEIVGGAIDPRLASFRPDRFVAARP